MRLKIEISARHIHLSQNDLNILFGPDYQLNKFKKLSQETDFAAKEEVTVNHKGATLKARVVGPVRGESQVELSATEAVRMGVPAPLRLSGDLKRAPTVQVIGLKGLVECPVIIARRHLHCSAAEAKKIKLRNNQKVKIALPGARGLVLKNVVVRVKIGYHLAVHIDTDEANAAGLKKNWGWGTLLR